VEVKASKTRRITHASAKARGRKFQRDVADQLRSRFQIPEEDLWPAVGSENGEDIKMGSSARRILPISVECKCVESLNIWEALKQAEVNAKAYEPVVAFKRNHSKVYAAIEFDFFLELLECHAKQRS
jgi:hypothetical protein